VWKMPNLSRRDYWTETVRCEGTQPWRATLSGAPRPREAALPRIALIRSRIATRRNSHHADGPMTLGGQV
jgi:hypothetical protein